MFKIHYLAHQGPRTNPSKKCSECNCEIKESSSTVKVVCEDCLLDLMNTSPDSLDSSLNEKLVSK